MKDNLFDKLRAVNEGTKSVGHPIPDPYEADKQFMAFMKRMMTIALLSVVMICYTAYEIAKLFAKN